MLGNDIMSQIERMSRAIALVVLNRSEEETRFLSEDETGVSPLWVLESKMRASVKQKNICEAENLLFEYMEEFPLDDVRQIARDFYEEIARLPEEELRRQNFSHEEILQGLQKICEHYEKYTLVMQKK